MRSALTLVKSSGYKIAANLRDNVTRQRRYLKLWVFA